MRPSALAIALVVAATTPAFGQADVKVLATNKTSTMEKEMNEAAAAGYRFAAVMGGETSIGGAEVVVVMTRAADGKAFFHYKLLATSKTSTMQKEIQESGDAGYEYKGQTVFKSAFGGKEVATIVERDTTVQKPTRYEYRVLATKKTSTVQKEIGDAAAAGFQFVGMTVADTAIGGNEIVAIMRRAITQ